MFCSKTLQNKTDKIQKQARRIVYNEPSLDLDELVELDKGLTIHARNIITLLTEVHKTFRRENPVFMNDIFTQNFTNYKLRIINLLKFPKVNGSKYGSSSFVFRASYLWNQIPDSIKKVSSTKNFKKEMLKNWQEIKCTCAICK